MNWPGIGDWPELDDGHVVHAPVGSFRPNAFGLHEVHGNLREWCRDTYTSYRSVVRFGDGERRDTGSEYRMYRGGAFVSAASNARSSFRPGNLPEGRNQALGVRPARALED